MLMAGYLRECLSVTKGRRATSFCCDYRILQRSGPPISIPKRRPDRGFRVGQNEDVRERQKRCSELLSPGNPWARKRV